MVCPLAARLASALFAAACLLAPAHGQDVERTFAVRIDGRIAGTVTETEQRVQEAGRDVVRFVSKTHIEVEVLAAPIDQRIEQTWLLDPADRRVLQFTSKMTVGGQKTELGGRLVDGKLQLDDGSAPIDPATVVVAPDYRWLLARGPQQVGDTRTLDCFVAELGGVHAAVVRRADDREIDVLGRKVTVRVYAIDLTAVHVEGSVFVLPETGELVRYEAPANQVVMERVAGDVGPVARVDMTDRILVGTNLDLDDASGLTFVKLRARLDTARTVTAESLNVPGQTFTGTVQDGHVDGVFEIRPKRSDGSGSAPFPVPGDRFAAPHLQPFLAPEKGVIESDDPGIAAQARQLAQGATTCFQVVDRLARWAHEEVAYVIPGGGSAKGTFEQRQGECGGHSRLLAAMLRSLGIPARTPMGAMYVPLHGGSFGQHMWTEAWLGEAIGWLPVDCTANQPTWIDATHIRLADGVAAFQPQSVEVLDYEPKPEPADATEAVARRTDAFPLPSGAASVYTWTRKGQVLGDERLVYTAAGDGRHVFEGSVRLGNGEFSEETRTEVGDDGRLLAFHAERMRGPERQTFDVTVADGKAQWRMKMPGGDHTDTMPIDAGTFVLHNNCSAHFVAALARYSPLAEGVEVRTRMFHTEQRSMLPLVLRGGGTEAISIGGTTVQARIVQCELAGLGITAHVDAQGRMLRYFQKQGNVTIELQQL